MSDLRPEPSRRQVWQMFDRISRRYDLLNRLLSFRRDVAWRRRAAVALPEGDRLRVLDMATGTGDQLLALYDSKQVALGVGIDLAERMLDIAAQKIKMRGLENVLTIQTGDALAAPFPDRSFHAVSISFGIRNVVDVSSCLREMHRLLTPGGRALILEFSVPQNRFWRAAHLLYLRHVLPGVGRIISGDANAYRYLNETIESFPCGERFASLMRQAGFSEVAIVPLTGGIATLYIGEAS